MKCKKIYRYKGYAGTEEINFWLETQNTPDKIYLDGRLITNIKKI